MNTIDFMVTFFFFRVIKIALDALVLNMLNSIDPAFVKMTKMPWSTVEHVGDQSEYVSLIMKSLSDLIPLLVDGLPRVHFKFMCDNFVKYVVRCIIIHSL